MKLTALALSLYKHGWGRHIDLRPAVLFAEAQATLAKKGKHKWTQPANTHGR